MTFEDILLLFVVLALGVSWWLIRMLRRELDGWHQSLKEPDPRDLP